MMKKVIIFLSLFFLIGASLQKKSRSICNQKNIPLEVDKTINGRWLSVSLVATKNIEKFSLLKARGVDGVSVLKFDPWLNQKLEAGEKIVSNLEISEFQGLVYVIFDISLKVNGVTTYHSIPIALGDLSLEQKQERRKNIKVITKKNLSKTNQGALSSPDKKLHEMQLP